MDMLTLEATDLPTSDMDYISDMLVEVIAEKFGVTVGALGFTVNVWFSPADTE